jgi:hypothetical protein
LIHLIQFIVVNIVSLFYRMNIITLWIIQLEMF